MTSARILATIVILAVILFWMVKLGKLPKPRKLSNYAKASFFLIILGIFLGDNRSLGYLLIGSGMALAVVDIAKSSKKK
jgi:uncharacterized membrane protein